MPGTPRPPGVPTKQAGGGAVAPRKESLGKLIGESKQARNPKHLVPPFPNKTPAVLRAKQRRRSR